MSGFIPMALNTAICFLLSSAAVFLARPAVGFLVPLTGKTTGSILMRRLLPFILLAPTLIGWLRLKGEQAGYYNSDLGVVIMVTSITILLSLITWFLSMRLHKTDLQRQQAEKRIATLNLILEKKVKARTQKLKEANNELNTFIYRATHDLRTPIPSMLGLIDLLEREIKAEKLLKHLNYLKESCKKLDYILISLFRAMNVKSSKLKITKIDFHEEIADILSKLPEIKENDIQVHVDVPGNKSFYSDRCLLKIIFHELIKNAAGFADKRNNPSIWIRVKSSISKGRIEVSDNGMGISPEYIPKVTDMFFRANESSHGLGLGLYIVKAAVDKLKGSLRIKSAPGKGTAVTIDF